MKLFLVALVLGLALAAIVGSVWVSAPLTAVAVSIVAILFAYAWPYLLRVPAKRMLSTAAAIAAVLAITSPLYAPEGMPMIYVPVFIGMGVAVSFVLQLIRGTGRVRRLESLIGLSAGMLLGASGAGWVAVALYAPVSHGSEFIHEASRGQAAVLCVALTAVVGALIPLAQPRIQQSTAIVMIGVGLFFGGLVGSITQLTLPSGVIIGLVTGALMGSLASLASPYYAMDGTKRVIMASGLLPVGILGSIAFFGATFFA